MSSSRKEQIFHLLEAYNVKVNEIHKSNMPQVTARSVTASIRMAYCKIWNGIDWTS